MPSLILGSGSPYRRQILNGLGLTVQQVSPDIDESGLPAEAPRTLARRLAEAKADAVAGQITAAPPWVVIGCDQVCHVDGEQFGKPGNREGAALQLARFSDHWVTFSTGLCLVTNEGVRHSGVEDFECRFRALTSRDIERYLDIDEPWDCAGAIKAEAAGLTLMEATLGRDINTLYGLPVMLLREYLDTLDFDIFDFR